MKRIGPKLRGNISIPLTALVLLLSTLMTSISVNNGSDLTMFFELNIKLVSPLDRLK